MTFTKVQPSGDQARDAAAVSRRDARWDALRVLWSESSLSRVRNCRRVATDSDLGVAVMVSGNGGAGLSGVQTCGSTWACPCCSAKVAAHRADEIARVLAGHKRDGGAVVMATFTMRHHKGHGLAALWDALSYAWEKVTSGRGWLTDRATYGIAGYVRVVEVTHGDNGWHVHIHSLLLLTDVYSEGGWLIRAARVTAEDDSVLAGLHRRLYERWSKALGRKHFAASREHGVDIRRVEGSGSLGEYFTKATWELTGAGQKASSMGNVTPFGLLARLVAEGQADDLDAWHEWESASKGRRQLTWSAGLRARYLTEPEMTDEEVAAADDLAGEVVANLSSESYRMLAGDGLVPVMLTLAERSPAALWDWLTMAGVHFDVPDAGQRWART